MHSERSWSVGVSTLSEGLGRSTLVNLDLRDCSFSTEGAASLASALPAAQSLKVLRLDENSLRVEGAVALADGIRGSQLEELYVNDASINDDGGCRCLRHHNLDCNFS